MCLRELAPQVRTSAFIVSPAVAVGKGDIRGQSWGLTFGVGIYIACGWVG